MGKTAFSGPVYGSKQTLQSFRVSDISSGGGNGLSSVVLHACIVPSGEDWFGTEFNVFRSSTGSTSQVFTLNDDSTQVSAISITSSVASQNSISILTKDGGEYEGTKFASGSTLTFTVTQSSVVGASSGISITLSGYRRWIPSTRTE